MGANIVNTMCEKVSSFIPHLFQCDLGLRILTNYTDRRLAKAECTIPKEAFAAQDISGAMVVDRIEKAYKFAYYDVYRATTNNKGIMNGIDAVLIASGNDWRAIEAGAHAYSCRDGQYRPMATWKKLFNGDLYGQLELPMAVGTVGGVTKLHPTAQIALKILWQSKRAQFGRNYSKRRTCSRISPLYELLLQREFKKATWACIKKISTF